MSGGGGGCSNIIWNNVLASTTAKPILVDPSVKTLIPGTAMVMCVLWSGAPMTVTRREVSTTSTVWYIESRGFYVSILLYNTAIVADEIRISIRHFI